MTRGSKWELDVYTELRSRGYDVVHAMAQYQEQLCDLQVAGNAGNSIYIECKSTKGNKVSLNRNKHVKAQYLRFCELSARHDHNAFYAVRFFEGHPDAEAVRYYEMPVRINHKGPEGAMILKPTDGLKTMPFGLDAPFEERCPPINPPIYPPVEERSVEMREPHDP